MENQFKKRKVKLNMLEALFGSVFMEPATEHQEIMIELLTMIFVV
jgi:hypothetical protein